MTMTIELLRLPQADELASASQTTGEAHDLVERVHMTIAAARLSVEASETNADARVELTPGQAWRLTQFARDVRTSAETLLVWADELERDVDYLYRERGDA